MNRREALSALAGGLLWPCGEVLANHYFHAQKTRTRCCLPKYDYAGDHEQATVNIFAIADPVVETVTDGTILESTSEFKWRVPKSNRNDGVQGWGAITHDPIEKLEAVRVRRKRFHFPASALALGSVSLSGVGLAIYTTGDLAANGRLFHDGGPNGAILSNRVTIHLRAYAGIPGRRGELIDMPMLWQATRDYRVRRGQPIVISSLESDGRRGPQIALRRHFDEITHMEVEMQVHRSR